MCTDTSSFQCVTDILKAFKYERSRMQNRLIKIPRAFTLLSDPIMIQMNAVYFLSILDDVFLQPMTRVSIWCLPF
jgi:hypothetical protein